MQTKSESTGKRAVDPSTGDETTTARSRVSASSSITSVLVRMSTLSRLLTRFTRYCDIESPSLGPRTSSVTREAYREKRTTACPAEFPPPTTATRQPRHDTASLGPAP